MQSALQRIVTDSRPWTEAEELAITREVLLLIAELHPLVVRDGHVIVPDITEEPTARIRRVEGELPWATGRGLGLRCGCSNVPARTPVPVIEHPHRQRGSRI
jgi:hypothetical protein